MSKNDLPKGFVMKLFGRETKTHRAGDVVVKKGGKVVATLSGVKHPMPVTPEALAYAFERYSLSVVDVDGNEYTLNGVQAAAARFFIHSLETARGLLRNGATEREAKEAYASFTQVGGKSRSGRKAVALSDLDGMSLEEIKALMVARGFAK